MNVRAGPRDAAPILGVLHSLIETDPHTPDGPPLPEDRAVGPSFNIVAISGKWLKIADIDATTYGYDPAVRKRGAKRNFQGSGWVHRSRVAIDPGFHDKAYDKPYFQPGDWKAIDDDAGALLTLTGEKQGISAELMSCEQNWLEVRYRAKARNGQRRTVTGWLSMRPHYIGPKICKRNDADCILRQSPEFWQGSG